jgi:hypothetical protein
LRIISSISVQACSRWFRRATDRAVTLHRAKQDASDKQAAARELESCKNVMALVEKQKHDAMREGALLRDEIVALRGKVSNLSAEKVRVASKTLRECNDVSYMEDAMLDRVERCKRIRI